MSSNTVARPALCCIALLAPISCRSRTLDSFDQPETAAGMIDAGRAGTDRLGAPVDASQAPADASRAPADAAHGLPPCPQRCGPPNGVDVCLQGRLYEASSLVIDGASGARPIKPDKGALIRIFGIYQYLAQGTQAPVLAAGHVDDEGGCFLLDHVPTAPHFVLLVDDDGTTQDKILASAITVSSLPSQSHEDLEAPVFLQTLGLSAGLTKTKSLFLWFRDLKTGKGVAGVQPTMDGAPPPWPDLEHIFFDDDLVPDPGAALSSSSGLVAVYPADFGLFGGSKPPALFGGVKPGCEIELQPASNTSSEEIIVFVPWSVSCP